MTDQAAKRYETLYAGRGSCHSEIVDHCPLLGDRKTRRVVDLQVGEITYPCNGSGGLEAPSRKHVRASGAICALSSCKTWLRKCWNRPHCQDRWYRLSLHAQNIHQSWSLSWQCFLASCVIWLICVPLGTKRKRAWSDGSNVANHCLVSSGQVRSRPAKQGLCATDAATTWVHWNPTWYWSSRAEMSNNEKRLKLSWIRLSKSTCHPNIWSLTSKVCEIVMLGKSSAPLVRPANVGSMWCRSPQSRTKLMVWTIAQQRGSTMCVHGSRSQGLKRRKAKGCGSNPM